MGCIVIHWMPYNFNENQTFKKNLVKLNIVFFLNFSGILPQFSFLMSKNYNWNKNWSSPSLNKSDKKKVCKNFFVFLILLDFFLKKKSNNIKSISSSVFISPKKNKTYTLLRAPFRHKLSKKHYTIVRYKLNLSLTILFNKKLIFLKKNSIFILLNFFKKKLVFFESNICQQHKLINLFSFYLVKNNLNYNIKSTNFF